MSSDSSHASRVIITSTSMYQPMHARTTGTTNVPVTRSTAEHYRGNDREQPFVPATNSEYDVVDVPMRVYPPLPGIDSPEPRLRDTYQRTDPTHMSPKPTYPRRTVVNHFALASMGSSRPMAGAIISKAMDLYEDLPQNCTDTKPRAATYTSPNERIISPVKRPSAPIPPTSAQVKLANPTRFAGDGDDQDDEDDNECCSDNEVDSSQYFDEQFRSSIHPHAANNRHGFNYSQMNRHAQAIGRQPVIVVNDGYDDDDHLQPEESLQFERST